MRRSAAPLLLLAAVLAAAGCGGEKTSETRMIVLGIDGLDPEMLQKRIAEGELPNFARLVSQGSIQPLGTSWPPQSPVAWSNFITGCNPGKHGLYDFIHVDRRSYGVVNSMTVTEPAGMELSLFGYKLPLSGGEQSLTRKFPAFWEVMDEAGVPVAVYRMPANFPPAETGAITYPDMGTGDITGALSGKAFLWTERVDRSRRAGDSYYVEPVEVNRNRPGVAKVEARIYGPPNTLRNLDGLREDLAAARAAGDLDRVRDLSRQIEDAELTLVPFTAYVDLTAEQRRLAVEVDGHWVIAEEGGWSDWVPVTFDLMPLVGSVGGWTRFLFKSADPFELYAAPVQIDPYAPVVPISTPEDAAAELADAIGIYYTQGFPDAYKAYKADLLDTGEFVGQSDTVVEERMRMMDYALDQFDRRGGLLFFYFGSLDMRCHMLWHCQDGKHPHQEPDGPDHAGEIDRIYQQMDAVVGRLMARMEAWPGTQLAIISDHGFAPFHRKMHVNDWLLQEGYLVLKDGVSLPAVTHTPGDPEVEDGLRWEESAVDWSRTRAYCVGFNGIILNRRGREPRGIVSEAEAGPLLEEIREKLLGLEDGGARVLTDVRMAEEVFTGPQTGLAPDLQLGFNRGFGASDECAVGEITGEGVVVDNDSRWSGSHLMDPRLVPGTLILSPRHDLLRDPRLEDVTATLYRAFSVAPPPDMDGQPLFEL